MEYRTLGRSGLRVSPLCLGTMMFGGATDEADSRHIIARAADEGVNFIDTADVYNEGRSEEVVGRAIATRRGWWVLATKFANRFIDGKMEVFGDKEYVKKGKSLPLLQFSECVEANPSQPAPSPWNDSRRTTSTCTTSTA